MEKINEILDLAFAGCDAADKEEAKEVWRTYNAVYKGVSEFDNQQDWKAQGDAVEMLTRAFAVVFERVVASGAGRLHSPPGMAWSRCVQSTPVFDAGALSWRAGLPRARHPS